jgi:hypothetical protein
MPQPPSFRAVRVILTCRQRSGLIGCICFTVTSLSLMTTDDSTSAYVTTISRGVSFVVGVVASVVINWIIWPFVARHELRKSLAMMLFFMSIVYRSESSNTCYLPRALADDSVAKASLPSMSTTTKGTARQRKTLNGPRCSKGGFGRDL